MKVKTSELNGIYVVGLSGKIMGGPESVQFHDAMKQALAGNTKRVIIDLGEVEWMNSSGIGLLVSAYTTLKNAGAEMKLARTTDKIQSLLVITKLNSVFDSHDTVESAVKSFG
ncbi:MAG: STAS domain-containing protein [Calditrichaeota bacterium]|nr:STAS domain-containing protein [Calditrichota bacterium]MCB9366059.1 STAS domain-containing protein [Calditrichota bacterium]MCB9391815.1 STAS domain-containing protein [Calditrichota bacterium]